jgi:hypothetical protein
MIGVYTAVCEEDACWIEQYLKEIERLNLPFAIHLDRCSAETTVRLTKHSQCIGMTFNNDPGREFVETDKQGVFDTIADRNNGFTWAMAWDIDETYERDAPAKLAEIDKITDADYLDVKWINLWGDPQHIRVDTIFSNGHRVKFYNVRRRKFEFVHAITNGPKMLDDRGRVTKDINSVKGRIPEFDLVCLHHGLMTRELRILHKERWDRIYKTALKGDENPYHFWKDALDEEKYPPIIVENIYL